MRHHLISRVVYVVIAVAVCCLSISCHRKDPNIPKAVNAIRTFNGRFNAAQFHDIYLNADPRFQQSTNEAEFTTKLSELLRQHAPIQESNVNGFEGMTRWQLIFPELKPTRSMAYYSRCREGGFQELFLFDVTGDEAKLLEFSTSIEEANSKLKH